MSPAALTTMSRAWAATAGAPSPGDAGARASRALSANPWILVSGVRRLWDASMTKSRKIRSMVAASVTSWKVTTRPGPPAPPEVAAAVTSTTRPVASSNRPIRMVFSPEA